MKLWHDDIRRPPDGSWMWARTNKKAVAYLLLQDMIGIPITEASLDHDLGLHDCDPDEQNAPLRKGLSQDGTGVDLCKVMLALSIVPPKVTIHSWNPEGANYMARLLTSLSGAEVIVRPYEMPSQKMRCECDPYGCSACSSCMDRDA